MLSRQPREDEDDTTPVPILRPDNNHKRDLSPLFGYGTDPDSALPERKRVPHGFKGEQLYPFYFVVWPEYERSDRCRHGECPVLATLVYRLV